MSTLVTAPSKRELIPPRLDFMPSISPSSPVRPQAPATTEPSPRPIGGLRFEYNLPSRMPGNGDKVMTIDFVENSPRLEIENVRIGVGRMSDISPVAPRSRTFSPAKVDPAHPMQARTDALEATLSELLPRIQSNYRAGDKPSNSFGWANNEWTLMTPTMSGDKPWHWVWGKFTGRNAPTDPDLRAVSTALGDYARDVWKSFDHYGRPRAT